MKISTGSANFGNKPNGNGPRLITVSFDGNPVGTGFGDNNETWIVAPEPSFDIASQNVEAVGAVSFGTYRGEQITFSIDQKAGQIGLRSISAVYIDASQCPGTCQLTSKESGHRITVRGGTQGWYPMVSSVPLNLFEFTLSVYDLWLFTNNVTGISTPVPPSIIEQRWLTLPNVYGKIRLTFTDIDMPAASWDCTNPNITMWLDASGTIAAANTFQTPLAAQLVNFSGIRYGVLIQNPTTAVEPLYVGFQNANLGGNSPVVPLINNSIQLAPGKIYTERGLPCNQNRILVAAATVGHVFICKELK